SHCPAAIPALHSFPPRRSSDLPSLVASAVTYSDRETGRSSTTCHTPDFGHSEAATKALAASSAWIQDQIAAPPSTRTGRPRTSRSEEHTSELQSRFDLVCRLLL